jgi:hypothetical protein
MLSRTQLVLCGTCVAALAFFSGLSIEAGVATVVPANASRMTLDRAAKGDKLPTPTATNPASRQTWPEGCESSFSPIQSPRSGEGPGRCVV